MIRMAGAFLLAAGLAHYLTPVLRQAAIRFGIVDRPDGKLKNHRAPVPYLGGIAIYLSFLLSLALTVEFRREVLGILLAGAIVVILGLIDDLGALSPAVKLAGQVVAILTLMKASVTIKLTFLPPAVALPLSFLWLLAITNAFNLIDIMDGLASGVGLISALVLACVAAGSGRDEVGTLLAGLAGSLAGFLRYNFEPARIYLGDTGSLFLGLMLGALAMNNSYTSRNLVASVSPVVILGVPLFDMIFVMFIRWRRGIPVMRGSPDHFPLRLRKWRLTTRQTVAASYAASVVLGGVAIAMMLVDSTVAVWLLAGTTGVALALGFYLKKIDMTL
ncbi:MAG: undecaprenyl/decaprenyl-phosphate alpha-N-acetylglucosaminyl 1-phosphate transferase [Acidobacteria bacterium]|nr:undecaprenyl/decaprenyl-phosphate alpha-N-acetylglucosaminyl 1-phosphate transferase [Acidobacteriota bacterium]